jgi:PBP1b-binding outer membrane lipoprotein LpoB
MKKTYLYFLLVLALISCNSGAGLSRLNTDESTVSSAKWSTTDTDLATKTIVEKIINHSRYKRYLREQNYQRPKIFVSRIINKTPEGRFPVDIIGKKILNNLADSGKFNVISTRSREKILKEVDYQNIDEIRKISGADIVLLGEAVLEEKILDKRTIKEYFINVKLVDTMTGREIARIAFETTKYSQSGWWW